MHCGLNPLITNNLGITQARWPGDDPFITIPHVEQQRADFLRSGMNVSCLGDLVFRSPKDKRHLLESIGLSHMELKRAEDFVNNLPAVSINMAIAEDAGAEQIKIPDSYFQADMRKEVILV